MTEAATESAGTAGPEVVDEDVKADETISTAVAEYSPLIEGLARMRHELKDRVFDLTSVKGDKEARQARKQLVTTRTTLGKRRDDLKRDLRASVATRLTLLDSEAARLIGFVEELEKPIDEMIAVDEARRVREKKERDDAETERQTGHRDRINDIVNIAVRAAGMGSAEIQSKIELVTRTVVDDSFEEFKGLAVNSKAETLLKLADLLSNAKAAEQREAEAEANRQRLEQLERENAERIAREAEERKKREAAEIEARRVVDEERAAEKRAADERLARSDAANELVAEIDRIQRRAFTSSAAGLLELVTLIEHVVVGDELGEFAVVASRARDKALHELHDFHRVVQQRETEQRTADAETRRLRDEQAAAAEQTRMAMQQIDGIRQQLMIAHVGRAPYFTGANVHDVEKIIAETEAWLIDDANFGILVGTAQVVKDATLGSLRSYLAELIELRDAPPLVEQFEAVKAEISQAVPPAGDVEPTGVLTSTAELGDEPVIIGIDPGAGDDQTAVVDVLGMRADNSEHGALTDAADALHDDDSFATAARVLIAAVVSVMKDAVTVKGRGKAAGTWSVPDDVMQALKAALRAMPLDDLGVYYAEDGTLMNADGTRSVFDDVAD